MAPPHYDMVSQQYDELCTVYGMICSVDGLAAETCGDISSNAGLVGKMVELFNLCELPPDRMKRVIIDLLP